MLLLQIPLSCPLQECVGQPSCVVDGGPHCLQKFTQHSGGTNLLQRFQWLHENKGRSWESQPAIRVEKTRWPFKSGQCCVPRVFNGDRKGLRKTPLYMLFSTIVCNSALTAPGQKPRDREREARREGGGTPRGSRTRKRAVIPQKTKFWSCMGLE